MTQGNVDKCKPYSVNAIQLWGLPWDGKELHHTQFVFGSMMGSPAASTPPAGNLYISKKFSDAKNSSYPRNDMRGLLAAAAVPTAGSEKAMAPPYCR